MNYDYVIVGAGVAGLFCALNISENKKILIVSKSDLSESDSYLAQGGICVQNGENDFDSFVSDTMKAGRFENDENAVKQMAEEYKDVIKIDHHPFIEKYSEIELINDQVGSASELVLDLINETKLKINRITSNYEGFTQGNKLSTKQKDPL